MSRRKQANPAKLGESDIGSVTTKEEEENIQVQESTKGEYREVQIISLFKSEKSVMVEEEGDEIDLDLKEEERDELMVGDDEDDEGSLLNGQGSFPCSSSPASSCQSSLSDVADAADESFTMGATATTPYECNICKRAFARSSLLSKHVQTHTEQLQFSCPYCRRLFKHKRSRDRHTKLHTGDKKYKCLHCDSAFARSDHLKIHMKTHDNKKPHQCELCNRGYNTAAALASHQQHHSKQEQKRCGSSSSRSSAVSTPSPGNFRCIHCSETFEKADLLQNHMVISHKSMTPPTTQSSNLLMDTSFSLLKSAIDLPKIACMYCGKDFLSMNHMYQHIHVEHRAIFKSISQNMNYTPLQSPGVEDLSPKIPRRNNSPTYACDRCTMRFDSPLLLHEHVQNVHCGSSALGMYKYDIGSLSNTNTSASIDKAHTNATQSKPTDLSRRRRSENPTEYKAEKRKCDETQLSKQPSPTTESLYDSNDKPCICSYCYAQMPNFKMFLLHMETHVAINATSTSLPLSSVNNLISCCPLCGEPARNALELGRHIFGHAIANVTARCCHCCKKPFDQMDQLQKHLLESHSQTIYKCIICNEIFDTQLSLQVHFSNKHSPECKHYRCNLCSDQIFHDRLTAELHVNMKHSIQAPVSSNRSFHLPMRFPEMETRNDFPVYQCPFCQKAFKDEYLQYVHILKEHNDTREGENYLLEAASSGRRVPTASPNFTYNKTVSSPENLNKHDIKVGSNISCEICNRTDITSEAELAAHKKLHHAKSKVGTVSLQCAYCNEHCKSRSDLENHMKSHQVVCGKGKHKCNICDEIFSSNGTLAEHKLSHCKIIAGSTCTQCKTILRDERSFYNHQFQHTNSNSVTSNKNNSQISLPANCIICCQTLQTDVEIKLHAKFHLRHLLQKEFICGVCNKIVDNHTAKQGDVNNTIICIDCLESTTAKINSYNNSQIEPEQKRLFTCLKCSKSFKSEDEIKKHAAEHLINEEANLECHLCRNVLPSPVQLQIHLIEHNFMGMGQFRCYVCSSVFTTAAGLRGHIIEHGLNNKPYECSECNIKFFFDTELENHRYIHMHTKTLVKNGSECYDRSKVVDCTICGNSFTEKFYYSEHVVSCKHPPKQEEEVIITDIKIENEIGDEIIGKVDNEQ